MKIINWSLSLNKKKNIYINREIYEEVTKHDFNQVAIYLFGMIDNGNSLNKQYIILKLQEMNDNKVISINNTEYELGERAKSYQLFEEAVDAHTPVVYDWAIGADQDQNLILLGHTMKDDQEYEIKEKIVGQNPEQLKLILEYSGEVFMVWSAAHEVEEALIKSFPALANQIYFNEPIDLYKYFDFFKSNIDVIQYLINKNETKQDQKVSENDKRYS